jgi:hypothetical protein
MLLVQSCLIGAMAALNEDTRRTPGKDRYGLEI